MKVLYLPGVKQSHFCKQETWKRDKNQRPQELIHTFLSGLCFQVHIALLNFTILLLLLRLILKKAQHSENQARKNTWV